MLESNIKRGSLYITLPKKYIKNLLINQKNSYFKNSNLSYRIHFLIINLLFKKPCKNISSIIVLDKTRLLYYIDRLNINFCLCILILITYNIYQIVYSKSYSRLSNCYKIVIYFWYRKDLIRLF